jgi:hypothetical protein
LLDLGGLVFFTILNNANSVNLEVPKSDALSGRDGFLDGFGKCLHI